MLPAAPKSIHCVHSVHLVTPCHRVDTVDRVDKLFVRARLKSSIQ